MTAAAPAAGPMARRTNPLPTALGACRAGLFFTTLLGAAVSLLLLTAPLFMMQVFDRVVVSRSLSTLVFLVLIALAAVFLYGLLEGLRSQILVRIGVWLERALAPAVLERGFEQTLAAGTSRIEALRDLDQVRTFIGGPGLTALLDAVWTPAFLAFAFILHPLLGTVALGGMVVSLLLALGTSLASRRLFRESSGVWRKGLA
ncbi:MAG: type I secretion system permease/ATPase, partial [Alphaproteobacteria bacterium]